MKIKYNICNWTPSNVTKEQNIISVHKWHQCVPVPLDFLSLQSVRSAWFTFKNFKLNKMIKQWLFSFQILIFLKGHFGWIFFFFFANYWWQSLQRIELGFCLPYLSLFASGSYWYFVTSLQTMVWTEGCKILQGQLDKLKKKN